MAAIGRNNGDTLALALAGGDTVAEAVVKAAMSERTAYRWLADASVRQLIQELRNCLVIH